jgi:hypothetical protein
MAIVHAKPCMHYRSVDDVLAHAGYFSRVLFLRQLLQQFLKAAARSQRGTQVLSLGAGFDTTFFHFQVSSLRAAGPKACPHTYGCPSCLPTLLAHRLRLQCKVAAACAGAGAEHSALV